MRRSGSSAKRKTPPGASTRFTSRKTLSMSMNWLSIWKAITKRRELSRKGEVQRRRPRRGRARGRAAIGP